MQDNFQFVEYKNNQYLEFSNADGIILLNKFLHEKRKYFDWTTYQIVEVNSFIFFFTILNFCLIM